jgi:hypothetical protein
VKVPECSVIGWATLVVLFLTGVVVLLYTRETWLLRRESQLQTELQTRPFLSLECWRIKDKSYVGIVNIGMGLARNIRIGTVMFDTSMEIRSRPITHIKAGDEAQGPWRVWVRPLVNGSIGEMPGEGHHDVASRNLTDPLADVKVVLEYASMVGQRYETTVRIHDAVAEIVDDRRLGG